VSHLTLDDAATLLLQLEAGDTGDLTRLRDALTDLAFENRVALQAQPHVARAARVLGTLIKGAAEDPDAALMEVSHAIEDAMRHDSAVGVVARTVPASDAPASNARDNAFDNAPTMHSAMHSASHDGATDRLSDDADRDLIPDFIMESQESVANAERALLQLEENPTDEEAINTVFRAFHTVKGTSAFLGLSRIASFAHEAESLLSKVRDKEITYTHGCADLALRSVDMLVALLESVNVALAGDGNLPLPPQYHALLDALASYDPALDIFPATSAPRGDTGAIAVSATIPAATSSTADATIRVRTDRLDRLIDMIGELVIGQAMIAGAVTTDHGTSHELARKVSHCGKIVRELQALSMSMRMVPLRGVFQKLTRVARDTAARTGKQVQFITEGDDVEIDRTLADVIGDPLVHMVRNAVDHGIESPCDRTAAGKSAMGTVRLSAYNASGNVVVELVDDGRGLYRGALTRKAIEKGLIESDSGMSDSEVFALIFAPGFSTADTITDISGRGVGMDVVRRNIESIRGRIEIASVPGKGTTFSVRLPLTLAVTDGMLVRVGDERFVVPLTHIHMSFRPEPAMLSTVVGHGEVVLLRDELMPIVRLHELFDVPNAVKSPLDGLLMVVGDGKQRTAMLVDELLGQQQVVAKPLGAAFGKIPGVSGGAILADGRVGLILDVNETVSLLHSSPTSVS